MSITARYDGSCILYLIIEELSGNSSMYILHFAASTMDLSAVLAPHPYLLIRQ